MKTTTALLLSLSSLPSLAQIELVPGGDFQLSKPGEPEVTATLVGGFVPWNPPNPPTDLAIAGGGSANYGDDTTGENVGLIGWKKIQGNIDLLNNGVDGSIGCNAFAAWGGDSRIESDPALGTVQAGSVYTITVQVGGPDGGPISGPLAFHLAADGVPMTPISQVDVTLPGPGGFQEISRTYDATSIADHLGKALTIILGVEDANDLGNRVIFDNVSLGVEGAASEVVLSLAPSDVSEGTFDFSWNGVEGRLYDLVTSTDLSTPPATWPVYDPDGEGGEAPYGDLEGISELLGVPVTESKRFFALIEKVSP